MVRILEVIRKLLQFTSRRQQLVSRDEILMGREVEFPLNHELEDNLADLLIKLNQFRTLYGKPMLVSSGYRPGYYNTNAGGAPNSPHLTCQAVDFHDQDRVITSWVLANPSILQACGLYMEDPGHTPTWIHLQSRVIPSGKRIFIP